MPELKPEEQRVLDIIKAAPKGQIDEHSLNAVLAFEDAIERYSSIVHLLRTNIIEANVKDALKSPDDLDNYLFVPFKLIEKKGR